MKNVVVHVRPAIRLRAGSMLIEAMIAILIFAIFVTAAYLTLLTGQEGTRNGSNRIRGVHYTQQGLEAARSIRNESFALLGSGTHGYTIDGDLHKWVLSGTTLTRYEYDTTLTISNIDTRTKQVDAESTWQFGYLRAGRTFLTTIITDWRTKRGVGNWANATLTGSYMVGRQIDFNDLYAYKGYLYATSNGSTYGSGIIILDVDPPTTPTRVSSTFNIAANVYSPIAYFDRLYVATNTTPEIRAYSITSPTTLNAATPLLASATLPGPSGRGKSLAIYNKTLLVGATGSAGNDELYAYNITTGSVLTFQDSIDILGNPDINDIFVFNNVAYLAGSNSQYISIDISNPNNLLQLSSVNMGFQALNGVAMNGTGFYAALDNGLSEYAMRTGSGNRIPSTTGALYSVDLGAASTDLDIDPLGCHVFMATNNGSKELQIRSGTNTTLPELTFKDTPTGNGRAVHYSPVEDELYFATQSGIYIYSPGPVTTCI